MYYIKPVQWWPGNIFLLTALGVLMPVVWGGYPPIELGGIAPITGGRVPTGPFIGGMIGPGCGVIEGAPTA